MAMSAVATSAPASPLPFRTAARVRQLAPSLRRVAIEAVASEFSAFVLAAALAAAAGGAAVRRRARTSSRISRRSYCTGPGWTDELARIFDPREEGPQWEPQHGYRGRPRLRLLLDAEDLVHSYAKAMYEQTGKWTGPLSESIMKALEYGAWGGGEPEEVNPNRDPNEPDMTPPEILTFVAMPADLIEAVQPANLVDGYPENLREELGNVALNEDGKFINEFIRSLQDDNRLLTWSRPKRQPGGAPRPNALLTQKYYQSGEIVCFNKFRAKPMVLSQAMGSGINLKVGSEVEALKPGRFIGTQWLPSKWEKAEVKAANYDGTYDVEFIQNWGPYRERRLKGLKGPAMLSLRPNERYKDFGADDQPASYRLLQEMNYAQSMPASSIRMPGALDRLSDTADTEGAQDWFVCTSKNYAMTSSGRREEKVVLDEFLRQFKFSFRWVPAADGLRFEPVPNDAMAMSLKACHSGTASQFANAAEADREVRRKMDGYKAKMDDIWRQIEDTGRQPTKDFIRQEDVPRPAGVRANFKKKKLREPVPRR